MTMKVLFAMLTVFAGIAATLQASANGICGFLIILCLAFVFPKIGAAWAIALVIVLGQSAAALLIDHYGLLGMPSDPITISRAAGLALVALGVLVIRY
jgi:transporter family-2 protein